MELNRVTSICDQYRSPWSGRCAIDAPRARLAHVAVNLALIFNKHERRTIVPGVVVGRCLAGGLVASAQSRGTSIHNPFKIEPRRQRKRGGEPYCPPRKNASLSD
jgi:hypothetical protein